MQFHHENCHDLKKVLPLNLGSLKFVLMKTFLSIPLVSWENGIWMIGLFAVVVIVLVGAVLALMNSGKK